MEYGSDDAIAENLTILREHSWLAPGVHLSPNLRAHVLPWSVDLRTSHGPPRHQSNMTFLGLEGSIAMLSPP